MTNIKTDKVIVENGADFTFVCRKIPFSISCSELHQGKTNLIDLDLVNKMKIPLRNIRVTRMSLLGHDVRAVGRIKQTVQCVVNGRVQGNVHLEGRVVRDLFSLLGVDCLASMKTYERLLGRKPPDPVDEGYETPEDITSLGGDEEDENEEKEYSNAEDHQKTKEEVPPDPPDVSDQPQATLQVIRHPSNPNCVIVEYPDKEEDEKNIPEEEDDIKCNTCAQLNQMKTSDYEKKKLHCWICLQSGKPESVYSSHHIDCPTCPSVTPENKLLCLGPDWKKDAEKILRMRFRRKR